MLDTLYTIKHILSCFSPNMACGVHTPWLDTALTCYSQHRIMAKAHGHDTQAALLTTLLCQLREVWHVVCRAQEQISSNMATRWRQCTGSDQWKCTKCMKGSDHLRQAKNYTRVTPPPPLLGTFCTANHLNLHSCCTALLQLL